MLDQTESEQLGESKCQIQQLKNRIISISSRQHARLNANALKSIFCNKLYFNDGGKFMYAV
jgi:hypothetical protein